MASNTRKSHWIDRETPYKFFESLKCGIWGLSHLFLFFSSLFLREFTTIISRCLFNKIPRCKRHTSQVLPHKLLKLRTKESSNAPFLHEFGSFVHIPTIDFVIWFRSLFCVSTSWLFQRLPSSVFNHESLAPSAHHNISHELILNLTAKKYRLWFILAIRNW